MAVSRPLPAPEAFTYLEPFDQALVIRYGATPDVGRYKAAVELGAACGDPLAKYAIATWHLYGYPDCGVEQDRRRAVRLLRGIAEQLPRAAYDLAICYLDGIGVRKDARRAYSLLQQAAKGGVIAAMDMKAYCLSTGTGVRANAAAGRRLAERAAGLIVLARELGARRPARRRRRRP